MWKTYGFRKALGLGLYDHEFFAENLRFQGAYADLATVINSVLHPGSVCDFGCGNGFIIGHLKHLGVEVRGLETSATAYRFTPAEVRPDILTADILTPLSLGKFDLTISTEVAEHIPKAKAEGLIRNLAHHAIHSIFFTAAAPGQWGDGHINCQPKSYWKSVFLKYGWEPNQPLRERMLSEVLERPSITESLPWVARNLMIFTPIPIQRASRAQDNGKMTSCN